MNCEWASVFTHFIREIILGDCVNVWPLYEVNWYNYQAMCSIGICEIILAT